MSSGSENKALSADDRRNNRESLSLNTPTTTTEASRVTTETRTTETLPSGVTRAQSASPTASGSKKSPEATLNPSNSNKKSPKTSPVERGGGTFEQTSAPSPIRFGKCKWFNVAKGWGFITPNDGGVEVFVHQSVIQMNGFRSLGAQEDVEFVSVETPRGVEATFVAGREGLDCVGSSVRPRPHGSRFVVRGQHRRVRCYNCNRFNHIAAECKLEPQPRRCYLCQQEDHLIADCPRTKTQTSDDKTQQTMEELPAT